jgi:DNA invertase Pin-like site-specific DNA recombinase
MIALYVRQSVDKKDSISIEFQIDECKRKLQPNELTLAEVFSDKGFSGKSVNRPEFQRMMNEVQGGRVTKIIVYKLDRISRSLIDFLKIEEELQKQDVAFISCKEEFDTSTPMGKMMLHILMVFAEMERETIQKRILDNYYARGEKGFYLGGHAPFGYDKVPVYIDGKKTYTFSENAGEATLVKEAYREYAYGSKSINAIARYWNGLGLLTRKGKPWRGTTIAGLLTNPVFVKADVNVYNFLKSLKATFNNPVEDYIGKNGCISYGNRNSRKGSKFKDYENRFVTIGLHEGIITSDLWLTVQYKFKDRVGSTNTGSGECSWLQGLVRCASCGTANYVKNTENRSKKRYSYFFCRGKLSGACTASEKMIRVDFLESEIEKALLSRLRECQNIMLADNAETKTAVNELNIKLNAVEKKIENLVNSLAAGTETAMKFINEAIEKFGAERDELNSQILRLQLQGAKKAEQFSTSEIINDWESYETETKKKVAKSIIQEIKVNGYEVDVIFY